MPEFLFKALQADETLADAHRDLLLKEFDLLRLGYAQWKRPTLKRPWQAAFLPVKSPAYMDRVILVARKRKGQLKIGVLKALRQALEDKSLGFSVQWNKRVLGTMERVDGALVFRPDEDGPPLPQFAKRMTVLARGYGLQKLKKLAWWTPDGAVQPERLPDTASDDPDEFAFMGEEPFASLLPPAEPGSALSDAELDLLDADADEVESELAAMYAELAEPFPDIVLRVLPLEGEGGYVARMLQQREKEVLELLEQGSNEVRNSSDALAVPPEEAGG